jgi:hypothetical protein
MVSVETLKPEHDAESMAQRPVIVSAARIGVAAIAATKATNIEARFARASG